MDTQQLWIDCDPGIDDAITLLMALGAPATSVMAVSTVVGNATLAETTANGAAVLASAGRDNIPLYQGCALPMLAGLPTGAAVHGAGGLEGTTLPAGAPPQAGHGVTALLEALEQAEPQRIGVCAIGPLTNLAAARILRAEIFARIGTLVVMGGGIARGNVTPHAEFNVHVDPEAAAVVFASGVTTSLVPLDLTESVRADRHRIEQLRSAGTRCAGLAADLLTFYGRKRTDGGALHDPVALALLLAPGLFQGRPVHLDVVLHGPERGRTHIAADKEPNAWLAEKVDVDGVFDLLHRSLRRLP